MNNVQIFLSSQSKWFQILFHFNPCRILHFLKKLKEMKGEEKNSYIFKGHWSSKRRASKRSLPDCTQRYFNGFFLTARKQKIVWLWAVIRVLMMGYHAKPHRTCSCSAENVEFIQEECLLLLGRYFSSNKKWSCYKHIPPLQFHF